MEINLGHTPPLFAHDVAMSNITRTKKDRNGKLKKEAHSELVFIDAARKMAITRIVLPMSVLEEMPKMISDNLKKLKAELKDKTLPKDKGEKEEIKTETKMSGYLG